MLIGIDVALVTCLAVVWSVHLGINAVISQGILFASLGIMDVTI